MDEGKQNQSKSVFGRKRWTEQEDTILKGLYNLGYPPYKISQTFVERSKTDPKIHPRTQIAVTSRLSHFGMQKKKQPKLSEVEVLKEPPKGKPLVKPGICAITEDVSIGTVTDPKLPELDVPVYNDTEVSISQSDERQFFDNTTDYTIDDRPGLIARFKKFLNKLFGDR